MVEELTLPSEQGVEGVPNAIHHHYPAAPGHIGLLSATNLTLGPNIGTVYQGAHSLTPPTSGSPLPTYSSLATLLNPLTNSSHTRDRKISPPNSDCFPGTRANVIHVIYRWSKSSPSDEPQHILWVFGYAGCGKSAIAQSISVQLAAKGRLGASFFFFRGAGDRSNLSRFATTIASQIAVAIPGTAPHIESALRTLPRILDASTSLAVQLQLLVYEPILAVSAKWYRPQGVWKPFTIVIDGIDECEDKEGVANIIGDLINFFEQRPGTPLRFIITSRVDDHLHQWLHNAPQVRLLNLVDHTSDRDIEAALDATIEGAAGSRVLDCAGAWLSPQDKQGLVAHIGGSFIFMTTITKFLFAPYETDGRTPAERLPLALNINRGFDGVYGSILATSQHLPHFFSVVSTIALAWEALSVAQIADLLSIETSAVVLVLVTLHAIIQLPGDDRSPITLWHTSLRDFLTSESRAGSFFAHSGHHRCLAWRCTDLVLRPNPRASSSPAFSYARQYVWRHLKAAIQAAERSETGHIHSSNFPHIEAYKDAFLVEAPHDIRDEIFRSILAENDDGPHSQVIVRTIALALHDLSAAETADLLGIEMSDLFAVLEGLNLILQVPDDIHTPIAPRHASLYDFLTSADRSGYLFAHPAHHEHLAARCIDILAQAGPGPCSPAFSYAQQYVGGHLKAAACATSRNGRGRSYSNIISQIRSHKGNFFAHAPDDVKDEFYQYVLRHSSLLPHFDMVLNTLALAQRALSASEIADVLDIEPSDVMGAIKDLDDIIQTSSDERSPILPFHESLLAFLTTRTRSECFYVPPTHHRVLALKRISTCASSVPSPAFSYCQDHWRTHWSLFLGLVRHNTETLAHELDKVVAILRKNLPAYSDAMIAAYFQLDRQFFNGLDVHQSLRLVLGDLFSERLAGMTSVASLVVELLDPAVVNHNSCPHRTNQCSFLDAVEGYFHPDKYCIGSPCQELLIRIQRSNPQLFDHSYHLRIVMRGIPLLVHLCASGEWLTLFNSRGDLHPSLSTEYMFIHWTKHLALAIEANPSHPIFDTVQPTLIPIAPQRIPLEQKRTTPYKLPLKYFGTIQSNLDLAEMAVRNFMGPEGQTLLGQKRWEADYGPCARYITAKPARGMSVFDVLSGIRCLFSCYQSTCPHVGAGTLKCRYLIHSSYSPTNALLW